MKYILLGVLVFFFVYMPMKLLDTLVMPELVSLEHTYEQAGNIASHAAGVQNQSQQ